MVLFDDWEAVATVKTISVKQRPRLTVELLVHRSMFQMACHSSPFLSLRFEVCFLFSVSVALNIWIEIAQRLLRACHEVSLHFSSSREN